MALTQTQVSQLYVAIFNRGSEGSGNTYWQTQGDMAEVANKMLATPDAKDYFGNALDDDKAFVEWIYKNTFNKTYADDPEGIDYWVKELATKSRGEVVAAIVTAATLPENAGAAQDQFINRVVVSNYTAEHLDKAPENYKKVLGFDGDLKVTSDPDTIISAEKAINALATDKVVLTADTDIVEGSLFEAPMVYTPDGSDRILSLQDEDQLTGIGDDATLNVTLGQVNADEGTSTTVTPTLKNVAHINIDWTGSTQNLDLRYANGVKSIHIDKITADTTNSVNVRNIADKVSDLKVSNGADANTIVNFIYEKGVLKGTNDKLNLSLEHLLANQINQTSNIGSEGFEHVTIDASKNVYLNSISINELQDVKIKGDSDLSIVSLTPSPAGGSAEYLSVGNITSGINATASAGIRDIDASSFKGDLTLDITSAMGGQKTDPNNSGAPFFGTVEGGEGDDKFYTRASLAGNTNGKNIVDGGEGDNILVSTVGNITSSAQVKNIQTLELRDQSNTFSAVDMRAFDSNLKSIVMRDEDSGNTIFTLNNLTAKQAEEALTLKHSITGAGTQTVVANLRNASGTKDTVALTVENDKNTTPTFNYTLTAGGTTSATKVENVTLHDKDTESNTVTLTNNVQHTGTIKIDGGTAGTNYTVTSQLAASKVDASDDLSNLRLTVGNITATTPITQDVKLGKGNDVLTFANVDELDSTDSLSDAGGNDTVRAAFSQDANLKLDGIENLEVTATANVNLGLNNANIDKLIILADTATNNDTDNENIGVKNMQVTGTGAGNINNIITINKSNLTQLNFFGDADSNDNVGVDNAVHNFNGITLLNNTADKITVNVNTSLDQDRNGATNYNIGKITAHGSSEMDIVVSDEANANTTTTINNIYAKNMDTLTAVAKGNLNLGTVSGAPLHNSLKTVDTTKVGGNVNATIISLADNAVVNLGNGDNIVSALGSAGKNVHITAGNGKNTLTGTAQDDTIKTGSGNDTIKADRGDNVIKAGAGNDTVTAKEGNDTVDLGSGINTYNDNINSGFSGANATNTVSLTDGVANIKIDVAGDGMGAGDIDQTIAVGKGSDLTLSWTGNNLQTAVLDGQNATNLSSGAAINTTANSDLFLISGNGAVSTVNASAGNDIAIFTSSAASDGLDFNGGAGNDAAVGTKNVDKFVGGSGADVFAMQNTSTIDGKIDIITIADGESTASAWDVVYGFDTSANTSNHTATVGAATAGSDVLDLVSTQIQANGTVNLSSNIVVGNTTVTKFVVNNGLVQFETANNTVVNVGTKSDEIKLEDALAALATELNGTSKTVAFEYDSDAHTGAESTFVFQDGTNDTVVELAGVIGVGGLYDETNASAGIHIG